MLPSVSTHLARSYPRSRYCLSSSEASTGAGDSHSSLRAVLRQMRARGRKGRGDHPAGKKKQSECSAFIRVPQASEVGLSFSSSDAIPPPSVGNKALSMPALCHAFYLSTLPSASLSLPSAVGHSSVAASNCSKEHRKQAVNTFL